MSKKSEKFRFAIWFCIPPVVFVISWIWSMVELKTNTKQLELRGRWMQGVQSHLQYMDGSRWTYQDQRDFAELNDLRMPAGKRIPRDMPVLPPEAVE